jgi:hypothetical protein
MGEELVGGSARMDDEEDSGVRLKWLSHFFKAI